MGDVGGV
jgi:hypothetical protein